MMGNELFFRSKSIGGILTYDIAIALISYSVRIYLGSRKPADWKDLENLSEHPPLSSRCATLKFWPIQAVNGAVGKVSTP